MPQPSHVMALAVQTMDQLEAQLDDEIFDIADTASFFNMSNRVASGVDMIPNPEYHRLDR